MLHKGATPTPLIEQEIDYLSFKLKELVYFKTKVLSIYRSSFNSS